MGGAGFVIDPLQAKDDDTIAPDTLLWRAIDPRQPRSTTFDVNRNREIPSIGILRTMELSVRIGDRTTLAAVRNEFPGWKIAQFTAAAARAALLIIVRDPADPSHGLIYDKASPGKRPSQSRINKLIENDVTVLLP